MPFVSGPLKVGPAKRGQTYRTFVTPCLLLYVAIESLGGRGGIKVVIVIHASPPLRRAIHHVSLSKTKPPKPEGTSGSVCSRGVLEGVWLTSHLQ